MCLQHLPQGDIVTAYLEGEDLGKAGEKMKASGSKYARWVAEEVLPLSDADLSQGRPLAEVLTDWHA